MTHAPSGPPRLTRIIDAHTHIAAGQAALAVETMDRAGVAAAVVCEWHDGFGAALEEHLRAFGRFPGRFHVFGNIDFSGIDRPDFGKLAVEQLGRGVRAGMRGLKVFKNLGLEVRDASGRLVRVDDERFDPVWAEAGALGIPVLIHTADPRAFWQPIDRFNPWGEVLRGEPGWSYYRKGLPGRDELLAERDALVRRHPETNFIAPHLGSLEDDFVALADALRRLPNLHVDIAARLPHMNAPPPQRRLARQLCIDFADRVLFGSDIILLDGQQATDIQPQTFYTPPRLPRRFADPARRLVETTLWFYDAHARFLRTAERISPIPFLTAEPRDEWVGLDLPADVLEKICHANIERLLGPHGR